MKQYDKFFNLKYSVHPTVVKLIGKNKTVLDVGCSSGYVAERLKRNGCEVIGIEINPSSAKKAKKYCKKVIVGDAEEIKLPYKNYFDVILLSDVLEHLKDPWSFLRKTRDYLKDDGKIVASIPNICFLYYRLKIMLGKFHYQDGGVFERTHLRFFVYKSARELVESNYRIVKTDFTIRCVSPLIDWLLYSFAKLNPNLFALNFIFVAEKINHDRLYE